MTIKVSHPYLVFPANKRTATKKVTLSVEGKPLYSLDIHLDNLTPDFSAYVDVSAYLGMTLELSVSPDMVLCFEEADTIDSEGLYEEHYRPQIHFTTKNGWINDPNGLICLDGVYHLFYQHNPCMTQWGNMHWGHAISTDLLHWEEQPIALFPDHTGAMFSGSAISDTENRSGLGEDGKAVTLLFYTATSPFAQYLAYSTDGLKTIRKCDSPVIPYIVRGNRDPKVVFCEEWNAYALALYMERDIYALFRSEDLIHWDLVQRISIPEDSECPDLFPLRDSDGHRKWCLIGASDRYLIGDMTAEGFVLTQEVQRLHYGNSAYAAQTFSGLSEGRIVRVHWEHGDSTPRFNGQMGFPCELSLSYENGIHYLASLPIPEIKSLFDTDIHDRHAAASAESPLRYSLEQKPYYLRLKADALEAGTVLQVTVFGRQLTVYADDNSLVFAKNKIPLSCHRKGLDCTVIVDRLGMEIYLDGGRIFASFMQTDAVPDYNLPSLILSANTGCVLDEIELHALHSIWRDNR